MTEYFPLKMHPFTFRVALVRKGANTLCLVVICSAPDKRWQGKFRDNFKYISIKILKDPSLEPSY